MTEPPGVLEFRRRRRRPSNWHQPLGRVLADWKIRTAQEGLEE